MIIEIHQPELEALIQQRMDTGRYTSVEDVLMQALRPSNKTAEKPVPNQSLEEVFAKVRGWADDVDFSRDRSTDRPVDLS